MFRFPRACSRSLAARIFEESDFVRRGWSGLGLVAFPLRQVLGERQPVDGHLRGRARGQRKQQTGCENSARLHKKTPSALGVTEEAMQSESGVFRADQ